MIKPNNTNSNYILCYCSVYQSLDQLLLKKKKKNQMADEYCHISLVVYMRVRFAMNI
jgi:hypothetical protein